MLSLFCIRDSAAEAFMRPWCAQSEGAAIRSFSDMVNGSGDLVSEHPEDFTLFSLGSFDEQSGAVKAHEPRSLGNGSMFVLDARIPSVGPRQMALEVDHAEA